MEKRFLVLMLLMRLNKRKLVVFLKSFHLMEGKGDYLRAWHPEEARMGQARLGIIF